MEPVRLTFRALSIALLMALPAYAGDLKSIDGDTLVVISTGERIRLLGVDAPETHGAQCESERQAGLAAKRFTAEALERGVVTLERGRRDKYGRTLARVLIDGRDLAELLIEAGHGRAYHGEKRRPWC